MSSLSNMSVRPSHCINFNCQLAYIVSAGLVAMLSVIDDLIMSLITYIIFPHASRLTPRTIPYFKQIILRFAVFSLLCGCSLYSILANAIAVEKAIIEDFSDMVTKQDTGINDFYGNIGVFNKDGVNYGKPPLIIIDSSSGQEKSVGMKFDWNFTITNDPQAYTGVFFCVFGLCDTLGTFNRSSIQTITFQEHSLNLDNIDGIINEPNGARRFERLGIDVDYSGTLLNLRVELKDVNQKVRFMRFPVTQPMTIDWNFRDTSQYQEDTGFSVNNVKVVSLVIERINSNPNIGTLNIKSLWFVPDRLEVQPANDEQMLDLVERRAFQYFIDWTSRKTASLGIPQDRSSFGDLLSMGGVGFGLPAYVIGAERGWITRSEARSRTLAMLRILANPNSFGAEPIGRIGYKGWFYHFLGVDGKRKLNFDFPSTPTDESLNTVELSTIDTGLAIMGVLTTQSYFTGSDAEEVEIRNLAQSIYDNVDWAFMLESNRQQFYLGWKPNEVRNNDISAFLFQDNEGKGQFSGQSNFPQTLDYYTDEGQLVSILAMGSTTHSVPRSAYWCWIRRLKNETGLVRTYPGALFTYQFMQAFMDMSNWKINDASCDQQQGSQIDWFANSQMAIRTAISEVIANPKGFQNYGQSSWGVSSAEGPFDNYFAYAISKIARDTTSYEDGTITNYGMISSLGFSMKNSQVIDQDIYSAVMQGITGNWTRNQWHYRFGLPDAFNSDIQPATIVDTKSNPSNWLRKSGSWVNRALFSIDQGPMLLHIENARSGLIWNLMANNPNIIRAKQRLITINQPPQTTDLLFNGGNNSPIMGKLNGTDPENAPLTFSLKKSANHGKAIVYPDGNFVYVPSGGYSGDSFEFIVSDGTDIATGNVTTTLTNQPPQPQNSHLQTTQNTPVSGQLLATDPDNNILQFSAASPPTHGTVTINNDGSFSYTPVTGYSGMDSFIFQVTDGLANATASVTINIDGILPPALSAEPLPGVVTFVTGRSKLGLMSLIYCDHDCQTIYYRHLSNDGKWSAAEVVKSNWNRNTEFGQGTFAMDIDSLGRVHVFWGENVTWGSRNQKLAHATRDMQGNWSVIYENASTYGMIGRLNKVTITADDQIMLVTTADHWKYTWPFSYLGYFSGKVGSSLTMQVVPVDENKDEVIWDIAIASGLDAKPMIAIAQQQSGGSFATKIVYQQNNTFTYNTYRSGYSYCVRPIQIQLDNNIHVNSCGNYFQVSSPDTTPVLGATSFVDDMTNDESGIAFFIHYNINNKTVVLGRSTSDKSVPLSNGYNIYSKQVNGISCGANIRNIQQYLCDYNKIFYDANTKQLVISYIGIDKNLYVKTFSKDAVNQYLDNPILPLTVNKQGTGDGTVTSNDGHINCGSTCTYEYAANSTVILTPQPSNDSTFANDSTFVGWQGACPNELGNCEVTLNQAKTVTAIFNLKTNQLTVQKQGIGNGDIYSSPNGIQCGTDCTEGYTANTTVTLYAVPGADSSFVEWGGVCNGKAITCDVAMNAVKSAYAIFKLNQTITFGLPPTTCKVDGTCTVTATGGASDNPVTFSSLTRTICTVANNIVTGVKAGTCTVAADQAGNDNYDAAPQATQDITINKADQTISNLDCKPPSIAVGDTCHLAATGGKSGNPVTFSTLTPNICTVSGNLVTGGAVGTCLIAANQASNDNYNPAPEVTLPIPVTLGFALTVTNANNTGGTVMSDIGEIVCGTSCKQSFANGTVVTLAPKADNPWFFAGWSGVCHGKGATCQVTMDKAKSVTARFGTIRMDALAIDFNKPNGLWIRHANGVWEKLHPLTTSQLVSTDLDGNGAFDLVVDFKPYGIWAWMNRKEWTQLRDVSPVSITAADLDANASMELVASFAESRKINALLNNQQPWQTLFGPLAKSVTAAYLDENDWQDLLLDFAPYGLWEHLNNRSSEPTWMELDHNRSPGLSVVGDLDGNGHEDVVFSFGADGSWKWMNNSTWVKLHPLSPLGMVTADLDGNGKTDVAFNFGNKTGLWVFMNNQAWVQLHPLSPVTMAAAYLDNNNQQDLVIDFAPHGIWVYKNNLLWEKLINGPKSSRMVALPE